MKKGFLLLLLFCSLQSIAQTSVTDFDFIVATDGSGDFRTVQDAIHAVPALRRNRTTIFIKNGIYNEKLTLPSTANNVSFIGEDVEKTILTFDDFAQKKNSFGEEIGTSGSASFFCFWKWLFCEKHHLRKFSGPRRTGRGSAGDRRPCHVRKLPFPRLSGHSLSAWQGQSAVL